MVSVKSWLRVVGLSVAVAATASAPVDAASGRQATFASPEQAVEALVAASRSARTTELLRILGPEGRKLIESGDPVADRRGRERFVAAYDLSHRIEQAGADRASLVVGQEDWPLPIPLVREGAVWRFDTKAGAEEILNRRIGRNELNVIEVCRAYVEAQREYAALDRLGNGLHEYARRFMSTPGKRDGLYWPANPGEEESPLGPLVARAQAEGYRGVGGRRIPYHGYYFKILTRQGQHARRGALDYVVDGHMTRGFALVAFPAVYGDTGIMTFIVGRHGIVYEKNLGPSTATLARQMTEYDPDSTWAVH
jgi:hypothetical protein